MEKVWKYLFSGLFFVLPLLMMSQTPLPVYTDWESGNVCDPNGNLFSENRLISNALNSTALNRANIYGIGTNLGLNHNNYFTPGSNMGDFGGAQPDLASWQLVTGLDNNSLNIDPIYVSDSNLHVSNVLLNAAGISVIGINNDIDGQGREPFAPDIRASEFVADSLDAAIIGWVSPIPLFAEGLQPVSVVVLNNGTDTLTELNIAWEQDSVGQPTYYWTGTLFPGDTVYLNIGNGNFDVAFPHAIKAWVNAPNGGQDAVSSNDTLTVDSLYASLAGFYTIGGTSPDFPTFNEAVNAMVLGGIIDSVTFNVRSGTYYEQVVISEIVGTSAQHSIVFQSESQDSTDVVLTFDNSDINTNYTIFLNGVDHLALRHLTITTTSTSYGRLVAIENEANHITIENNFLSGAVGAISATLINSQGSRDDYTIIRNNYGINSSWAIFLNGVSAAINSLEIGTTISNNRFEQIGTDGIQLRYQLKAEIINNYLNVEGNGLSQVGMYLEGCYGETNISRNFIIVPYGQVGIEFKDSDGWYFLSSKRGLIANNFIYCGNTSIPTYGMIVVGCEHLDIYSNNVHVVSSHPNSIPIYEASGVDIQLFNNILKHSGTGYAIYSNSLGDISQSNHNDFYTNGTNLAYWQGNRQTLVDLQTFSGLDIASLNVDPFFESDTNLHVQQIALNGTGFPLQKVAVDFDGELRDPVYPDIGADEFLILSKVDAGIVNVVSPQKPFASGISGVEVVIRNFGADTLNQASIAWQVNGLPQPLIPWTGALPTDSTDTVMVGNFNFVVGNVYDIQAWSVNPNGVLDSLSFNDTVRVFNLSPALAGIYTIGGNSPNFSTITGAVDAMILGGIIDSVSFLIRNGTYTESVSIPEIEGASANRRILFRSESGDSSQVVWENSGYYTNYTLEINGADYVTFHQLTIQRSTGYKRVVEIKNGSNYLFFSYNYLEQRTNGSSSEVIQQINSSYLQPNDSNYFHHNHLVNGIAGFFLDGGNGSGDKGTRIEHNLIENTYDNGIYIRDQFEPKIHKNVIRTYQTYNGYKGIYAYNLDGAFEITQNQVYGGSGNGIVVYSNSALPTQKGLLANNFIQSGGTGWKYGLYLQYANYVRVFNNSIHSTNTDSTNSIAAYFFGGTGLDLRNNIFAHTQGGKAISVSNSNIVTNSNYNDLYTSGPVLGELQGVSANDLASWKSLTFGDLQSISANPLFVSDTNLHVSQILLDSAAQVLVPITVDIDGESRNSTHPDIGADESSYVDNDLGITAILNPTGGCALDSNEMIVVRIQNYGSQSQTGFNVGLLINGDTALYETLTSQAVAPGAILDYTFTGTVDLFAFGVYSLTAFTYLPTDTIPTNDALTGVQVINTPSVSSPVSNMFPIDGTIGLSLPINFSWAPAAGALTYDLYVWPDTAAVPSNPSVSNLSQISYPYSSGLVYGTIYRWKVVAKNTCSTIDGPEQVFTLRDLPDLIVNNITPPVSAFSGQAITINWEILNQGLGSTLNGGWEDLVYLSADQIYDSGDTYLGSEGNLTALQSGQGYVNSGTYTLPVGIAGTYYLIVWTGHSNQLLETENGNNQNYATIPITLTAPPDLQVTSILTPSNAFSGQDINVQWTVKNEGNGGTVSSFWRDRIYLSTNSVYNSSAATYLDQENHVGALGPDSSYTENRLVSLPQGIFGDYFIHVVTDVFDNVFEYVSEGNNDATSDTMQVFLTPPTDLVVSSLAVVDTASNQEQVTVQWIVTNQGGSAGNNNAWFDKLYLTTAPDSNLAGAIYLGSEYHSGNLQPGNSYSISKTINIPISINGDYYFYVVTDANTQIYEYTFETNNIRRSTDPVHIISPDLVVSAINVPSIVNSGQSIQVLWTLLNQGPGNLPVDNWTDAISLSTSPIYNPDSAIQLGNLSNTGSLLDGGSLQRQKTIQIPNGISGTFYFHVRTDNSNQVFEGGLDGNNITVSTAIQVNLSPWPDLVPAHVSIQDSTRAGETIDVSFFMKNEGDTTTYGNFWDNEIYISIDSVWSSGNVVKLSDFPGFQVIDSADSVFNTVQVTIPMLSLIAAGLDSMSLVYVYVVADANDDLFENTGENNNIARSNAMYVECPPPVDLQMDGATLGNDSLVAGQNTSVWWQVTNIGSTSAYWNYPFWYDGIYLSKDSIWDNTDVFVTDFVLAGPIDSLETYDSLANFTIPNGVSGTFCFLMVADHTHLTNDGDESNNVWMLTDTSGNAIQVPIVLPPVADLKITNLSVNSSGTAGQPVEIIWTVENIAVGPTPANTWTDRFYLSTDFVLGGGDISLGSKIHLDTLAPGASYTDTLQVFLPATASGNYILLGKTDDNNVVYEHQAEGNNIGNSFISVFSPPPADLVVLNVIGPDSALAGGSVGISWDLVNQGTNPAFGYMEEAIYLSTDTIWDITDILLGIKIGNINMGPLASLSRSFTGTLNGVALDDYFVIVRTDILNNIVEDNDLNNQTSSIDPIHVIIPELPLNVWVPDTMYDNMEIYYRLEIPDSLTGETLLVSLKADSTNGNNRLYLKLGDVPTQAVHDFSGIDPFMGNQEVLVPALDDTTYYLMGIGSVSPDSSQAAQLRARILPFEFLDVNAKQGGNTGSVTVLIDGSKLEPNVTVYLEDSLGATLYASQLFFIDPIKVYATFNLVGVDTGFYDVVGVNMLGDTTKLVDGFEVVSGPPNSIGGGGSTSAFFCSIQNIGFDSNLETDVNHPQNTRLNRIVPMTIFFENQGSVDIPIPSRFLVSLRGAPLAINTTDLAKEDTEILLEFREDGGPPNALRPGAAGSITVYSFSSHPLRFRLFR